ncbi:MAG TPA: polysaccharide deacetylase family protein [Chitinophagaceae bacterium]
MPAAKLPVLMYHQVTDNGPVDYLTIRQADLEKQLQYIREEGYTTISAQQLIDHQYHGQALPSKPVLLTFDDGYYDNYTRLYPLLVRYGMKATIFLVASLIGRSGQTDGVMKYMSEEQLREMDPAVIEFGLHTWAHQNYKEMTTGEIKEDIGQCKVLLHQMQIPFAPVLAYTYGAYPKKGEPWHEMKSVLQRQGVQLAFRIGNRLNRLPLEEPFVAQRIDIRGNESFGRFRRKLKSGGKLW